MSLLLRRFNTFVLIAYFSVLGAYLVSILLFRVVTVSTPQDIFRSPTYRIVKLASGEMMPHRYFRHQLLKIDLDRLIPMADGGDMNNDTVEDEPFEQPGDRRREADSASSPPPIPDEPLRPRRHASAAHAALFASTPRQHVTLSKACQQSNE